MHPTVLVGNPLTEKTIARSRETVSSHLICRQLWSWCESADWSYRLRCRIVKLVRSHGRLGRIGRLAPRLSGRKRFSAVLILGGGRFAYGRASDATVWLSLTLDLAENNTVGIITSSIFEWFKPVLLVT